MLSFNDLGTLGRLGNQMFQYAALLGIAKRRGYEFCIPASNFENVWRDHQLFEAFLLPSLSAVGRRHGVKQIEAASFAYDAALADACDDDVDLHGFFQSEKYFADEADTIRSEFSFENSVKSHCKRFIESIGGHAISLHVRRTDYLTQSTHFPPCSLDYYARALATLPVDLPVIVFSDDMDWCSRQSSFQGARWTYSAGNSNIVDMCTMSMCDHHIIANSSFSWWGAWLGHNRNKTIVAPKDWFGPGWTHDTRDLIPAGWIRL